MSQKPEIKSLDLFSVKTVPEHGERNSNPGKIMFDQPNPYSHTARPNLTRSEVYSAKTKPYSAITQPYSARTKPYSDLAQPYSARTDSYSTSTENSKLEGCEDSDSSSESEIGFIIGKYNKTRTFLILKGTVSVILSDPPCKDNNARFTTVTLTALSNQV